MKLYKLTDENGKTKNNTQWGENVTHTASGKGELCGPGWLHAYTDPVLAVLLNPIHAGFVNPQLWEAEGEIGKDDFGLKCGMTKLTTIKQIPIPKITSEHRVRFAILCVKQVYANTSWSKWANRWLNGDDRTTNSAHAAHAAYAADSAYAAAHADYAAAYAAHAAADAAYAAADAAYAAAYDAHAAAYAAHAAHAAAHAAHTNVQPLDLISIAHEACK